MTRRNKGSSLPIAIFVFIAILLGSCSQPPTDFSGNWSAKTISGGAGAYFGLDLIQNGDKLHGQHDGGLNDGSRIDASLGEKTESVDGTIHGNEAILTIKSFYSENVSYQVSMVMNNDGTASWKVTKLADGQTYIPLEAVLSRLSTPVPIGRASAENDAIRLAGNTFIEDAEEQIVSIVPVQSDGAASAFRVNGDLLKLNLEKTTGEGKLVLEYYFEHGKIKAARETLYRTGAVLSESDEKDATFELVIWYFDENQKPILAIDRNQNEISKDKWDSTIAMIQDGYKEYAKLP